MGQPKSKRTAMLDPRHRAKLLKEKYRQQLAERREPESDSAETQAVDEVEDMANWAVDTVLVSGVHDPVLSGATNRFLSENRKPIDRIS